MATKFYYLLVLDTERLPNRSTEKLYWYLNKKRPIYLGTKKTKIPINIKISGDSLEESTFEFYIARPEITLKFGKMRFLPIKKEDNFIFIKSEFSTYPSIKEIQQCLRKTLDKLFISFVKRIPGLYIIYLFDSLKLDVIKELLYEYEISEQKMFITSYDVFYRKTKEYVKHYGLKKYLYELSEEDMRKLNSKKLYAFQFNCIDKSPKFCFYMQKKGKIVINEDINDPNIREFLNRLIENIAKIEINRILKRFKKKEKEIYDLFTADKYEIYQKTNINQLKYAINILINFHALKREVYEINNIITIRDKDGVYYDVIMEENAIYLKEYFLPPTIEMLSSLRKVIEIAAYITK